MSGPWTEYQTDKPAAAPAAKGPWTEYGGDVAPTGKEEDPGFLVGAGQEFAGAAIGVGKMIKGTAELGVGAMREAAAVPARIEHAAGKGPEVHTPFGEFAEKFAKRPGRTLADAIIGTVTGVGKDIQRMTTEPTTKKERLEFGESTLNVLLGAKGIYEGGEFAKRRRQAAMDARTAKIRAAGKLGADEARTVAEEQFRKDMEAAEAERTRRKEAIASEQSRAHVEADEAEIAARREAEHDQHVETAAAEAEQKRLLNEERKRAGTISKFREQEKQNRERASRASADSALPESDVGKPGWKGSVGRDMRASILSRFRQALTRKRTEGGAAFEKYLQAGRNLEQSGKPFIRSVPGRKLIKELQSIEAPSHTDRVTKYAHDYRRMATKLMRKLSGELPRDVVTSYYRPLSIDAIDEEIRSLRALENRTDLAGADAVTRGRAKELADLLEKSMREWVGEENYPREHYKAMSREFNQFSTDLMQKILGREDIEYMHGTNAPFKMDSSKVGKLFEEPENSKELRRALGDEQYEQLLGRHVANELYGKDAKEAAKWLADAEKKGWIKTSPATANQARDYVASLAQQQLDVKTLTAVADADAAAIKSLRGEIKSAVKKARTAKTEAVEAAQTKAQQRMDEAKRRMETTKGEANKAAKKQFEDTQQEYEKSAEAARGKQAEAEKLAKRLEDFMVGHKPTTLLGKFNDGLVPELQAAGVDQETIQMMQNRIRLMDKFETSQQRMAEIKKIARYAGLTLVGYKVLGAGKAALGAVFAGEP
jgi:hypothetical protein